MSLIDDIGKMKMEPQVKKTVYTKLSTRNFLKKNPGLLLLVIYIIYKLNMYVFVIRTAKQKVS